MTARERRPGHQALDAQLQSGGPDRLHGPPRNMLGYALGFELRELINQLSLLLKAWALRHADDHPDQLPHHRAHPRANGLYHTEQPW